MPVSMVILTKNESDGISDCLKSVFGWADEIIIVDDESTDNTRDICTNFTERIFVRKMELEGKQRNFGAQQARNEWVMMMDADERMTPEVKQEVEGVVASGNKEVVAYWVPRKNYIGDYWLRYGGWYPAPHIKLYKKDFLKWKEIPADVVHPGIEIAKGFRGGQLKSCLIHYNFKNVEDFIQKVNRQTTLEAIKWHLHGKKMSLGKGMWRILDRFCRRFIGKKGYRDGYYGFVAAVLSGFYQFAAYSKYRELKEKGFYLDRIKQC
jgi:glycosyltransferase involved in cell wall biosynthesis